MDSEFIQNLRNLSWETLVIAVAVFGLTMLIKWPIKRITAKLDENKRKAVNTVIVFIPMLLSFLLSTLYYGFAKGWWLNSNMFDNAISAYILAIGFYALYSRIKILIKGFKNKNSVNIDDENLGKETLSYIKKNIKSISKTLKVDEKKLKNIVSQIEKLLAVRENLLTNKAVQDLPAAEKLEIELSSLQSQKQQITQNIEASQLQIEKYKETLKA